MTTALDPSTAPAPGPRTAGDLVAIDLTDEERLLAEDQVTHDVSGVRALLAALELRPAGSAPVRSAEVVDLSIFRATGSRHLATLFSR